MNTEREIRLRSGSRKAGGNATSAASWAGGESVRYASPQQPSDDRAGFAEVDDAGVALAQHRHDLTDVFDAPRASFSDRSACGSLDFARIELMRQKAFDDSDLLPLFLSQIRSASLFIKGNRFATLLNHRLQQSKDLGLGKTLNVSLRTCRDISVFEP